MSGKNVVIKKTSSKTITITPTSSTAKTTASSPSRKSSCGCGGEETAKDTLKVPSIPPPVKPTSGAVQTAGPASSGIPKPTTGIPRPTGAIPRPVAVAIKPPEIVVTDADASSSSRPTQTAPQLVSSSVTTTARNPPEPQPMTKTVTTTKTTVTTSPRATGARPKEPLPAPASKLRPPSSKLQAPKRKAPASSTPISSTAAYVPSFLDKSRLVQEVNKDLMNKAFSSGAPSKATGSKTSSLPRGPRPTILTKKGPVQVKNQIILEQKVERGEEGEHVSELMTGIKHVDREKLQLNVQSFNPLTGLPPTEPPTNEVVIVKSSISTAGDVSQKIKTVIYERTGPRQPDADELSKMVDEENETIDEGLKMLNAKKPPPATPSQKAKKQREPEEAPEDLQPEMLAAIMYTEEQGMAMAQPPTQLYKILFPDEGEMGSIPVSSVVPAPLQDVVVPTSVAPDWYGGLTREELEQTMATVTERLQTSQKKPTDSMYAEAVKKYVLQSPPSPLPAARVARKKRVKPVGEEQAPWDNEDFQPIADLVGAGPSAAATSGFDFSMTEPERMFPTDTSGLEYILVPQPPSHVSRVQLRGSTKPSWFPGYYVALPERGRGISLTSSPSGVLASAWKEVQPSSFKENSFVVS